MHPSFLYLLNPHLGVGVCWSLAQLSKGERQVTPRIGRQSTCCLRDNKIPLQLNMRLNSQSKEKKNQLWHIFTSCSSTSRILLFRYLTNWGIFNKETKKFRKQIQFHFRNLSSKTFTLDSKNWVFGSLSGFHQIYPILPKKVLLSKKNISSK